MALETIRIITEAEQSARAAKEETAAACRDRLRQAREEGTCLVEQARVRAAEETAVRKARAEEEGKAAAMELAEKTRNQKAVLLASAEARMQETVAFILDRITDV